MSKANYASVSGIMLQRCRRHGTWADHAAALRLIELVANGGDESLQELAAARKEDALQRKLAHLDSTQAHLGTRIDRHHAATRLHLILDVLDII